MDNIEVEYLASKIDDNTTLVSSFKDLGPEWFDQHADEILKSAMDAYPTQGQNSVIIPESTTSNELTLEYVDELAAGLNSNRNNLLIANAIIARKILEDGFFGRTYESVVANINSDIRLSYGIYEQDPDRAEELKQVKDLIVFFNKAVGLPTLIRDAISGTYSEGNYVLYMRLDNKARPVIDYYPLSVAYPSDYLYDHQSVVEFSIDDLKAKLRKTYAKTKKNKAVYYDNMDKEVQANYPAEVVKGYRDGDKVVRLDPRYCKVVKFMDMGRKFGVSPLFRCLRPLIVLDQIEKADVSDSKARSKKIIFQKLRREVMGPQYDRKGFEFAAHAHQQAAQALKTNFGLYTAIPAVEDMAYVQAKAQSEDSINQQKEYTKKLMVALGIGFTDGSSSLGVTRISVAQLMKTINAIGEKLEDVLHSFYRTYLEDSGFDPELAPTIKIIDAEQMEMEVRKSLASFLFNYLGGSYETALDLIGYDVLDEKAKRERENAAGYDQIFYPRQNGYTSSGENNGPGRPAGNDENGRQQYDQEYKSSN